MKNNSTPAVDCQPGSQPAFLDLPSLPDHIPPTPQLDGPGAKFTIFLTYRVTLEKALAERPFPYLHHNHVA